MTATMTTRTTRLTQLTCNNERGKLVDNDIITSCEKRRKYLR